ncbi:MAG: hypothetical protein BWZ02_03083 [Lentisphaerae bacterium ADurb.BinA184]|nr:MAG: hypothetical protein BWZ02_03083 [Lentisphaerae bacterium ADurb.BinA184]
MDAGVDDGGEAFGVGGELPGELEVLAGRAEGLDHVEAAFLERDLLGDHAAVGGAGLDFEGAGSGDPALHRVETDQAGAEQDLGRLAGAAHVEPQHVAVAADAGEGLLEAKLAPLAGPQLDEAVVQLGGGIAGVDQPLGALDKEAQPHGLGPGVVVLDRHLDVNHVVHDRAEFIDLEGGGAGVEDQLRLGRVPHVVVEGVEERAVAADAAHKPGSEDRSVRGRHGHQRRPAVLLAEVVAVQEGGERDGVLDDPAAGVGLGAHDGIGFPLHALAALRAPVPVAVGADGVDVPAEQPELEAAGDVGVGADFQFEVVVPEHAVLGVGEHVGEAAARLEPRVLRIDGRGVGDVEVVLVVGGVDLQLGLDGGQEAEVGLRVVVPEAGERGGVFPLAGLHDAVNGRGLPGEGHTQDRCVHPRRLAVRTRRLDGRGGRQGAEPGVRSQQNPSQPSSRLLHRRHSLSCPPPTGGRTVATADPCVLPILHKPGPFTCNAGLSFPQPECILGGLTQSVYEPPRRQAPVPVLSRRCCSVPYAWGVGCRVEHPRSHAALVR